MQGVLLPLVFLSVAVVNSSVQVLYGEHRQIPVVFGIGVTLAYKENVMRNVTLKKSQKPPGEEQTKECDQVCGKNSNKYVFDNF